MGVVSSNTNGQHRLEVGEPPKQLSVNSVAALINSLAEEIGEWSDDKGFREDWTLADDLDAIAEREINLTHVEVDTLVKAANALRINVIGTKLMLTVSELSEALETLRDHGMRIMEGDGNFGEELADAVIRISDLAHMVKSPLGDEIIRKVDANVHRPFKHGRQV